MKLSLVTVFWLSVTIFDVMSVGNQNGSRAFLCPYISKPVSFMYPYVFIAGPNKHDVLLVSHVPTKREILTMSLVLLASRTRSRWLLQRRLSTTGGPIGLRSVHHADILINDKGQGNNGSNTQ